MELVTSMFPFNLKSISRVILLEFRHIIFSPKSSWLSSHGLIDTRSWQHIHKFSMTSRECQIWKSLDRPISVLNVLSYNTELINSQHSFATEFLFQKWRRETENDSSRSQKELCSYFKCMRRIEGANFGFKCLQEIFFMATEAESVI